MHSRDFSPKEPLPKRPEKGPAAKIDITLPPDEEIEAIGGILSNMDYPNSSNLNNDRSQMDNNRDFYDKWTPNDQQKIRLDESRDRISENLIQFSVSSASVTQNSNFSLHSDIVGNDGIVLVGGEDGPSNASRNIPSSIDTLSTDIPDTVTSNSDNNTEIPNTEINDVLPDVSLLRVHRADPPEDSSDNLPHFSLLMPRANEAKPEDTDVNLSSDSETFQSTSEIISDSIPNIPNLPMLQGKWLVVLAKEEAYLKISRDLKRLEKMLFFTFNEVALTEEKLMAKIFYVNCLFQQKNFKLLCNFCVLIVCKLYPLSCEKMPLFSSQIILKTYSVNGM